MNNIKKTVLGMLIGLLAFGISAYTTKKNRTIIRFYKTDLSYPVANDPRGYKYFSDNRCESDGNLCSALWDVGSITINDGDPLPAMGVTFQTGSVTPGHFE